MSTPVRTVWHLSLKALAAWKTPEVQPMAELELLELLELLLLLLLLLEELPPDGDPYELPPPPPPQADKTAMVAMAMQVYAILNMVSLVLGKA